MCEPGRCWTPRFRCPGDSLRTRFRLPGIGHILMLHAQRHAAQHSLRQLILDVLPSRTHVIDFYRRLGYTETDPYPTESPVAMVYLQRPV